MGLDRPVRVQYWRYVTGLLRGDLGESSSTGRTVLEDFRQRVPATLELTLASLVLAVGARHPARRAVRRPPRHRDRSREPPPRGRRRGHAELLDGLAPPLRLLLPARDGAGAPRPHRRRRHAAHPDHRSLRDRHSPHRERGGSRLEPPSPHAARAHPRLRRHGAAHADGARDHAGDPRIGLREGGVGGGTAPPAGHLRRRAPQRADPRHHAPRRDLRIPHGRQRGGGDGLRVAGARPLRRHLADDEGPGARSSPSCSSWP